MHRGPDSSCADTHAPVARLVQYGVFALAEGRPSSRPSTVPVTLLPPVSHLEADAGPSNLVLHWSAHPAAHEVRVIRTPEGGRPAPVPVTGNSCHLTGLHRGAGAVLRSRGHRTGAWTARRCAQRWNAIKATPRSEAQPIPKLRVRPVDVAGSVRARVAWTPVDHSEVRILRSDVPPPWPFGTWVSQEEMTRFGQEVTGRRVPTPQRDRHRG